MPILVTGSQGQLGSELCARLADCAVGIDRDEVDLTQGAELAALVLRIRPSAIIHCAAYTAVDRAEKERDLCFRINVDAVRVLTNVCRELDAPLVQISTDYVFGGDALRQAPYRETDTPDPRSVYAQSKAAAEREAAAWPRHTIVRTCGLYAAPRCGQQIANFPQTILRLGRERPELRVVADQVCTPTYVPNLAAAILFLLETSAYGVYHVVDEGETTWYAFACELLRQANCPTRVSPITTAEYGAPAPRPAYSVLDTTKYRSLGGPEMPRWQDSLNNYLAACENT